MASRVTIERRTEKLDFRVAPSVKAKLQAAAGASLCSLSDFVLESALAKAEEILADRRVFILSPEDWTAFVTALDGPPQALPALRELLAEPGYFGQKADE